MPRIHHNTRVLPMNNPICTPKLCPRGWSVGDVRSDVRRDVRHLGGRFDWLLEGGVAGLSFRGFKSHEPHLSRDDSCSYILFMSWWVVRWQSFRLNFWLNSGSHSFRSPDGGHLSRISLSGDLMSKIFLVIFFGNSMGILWGFHGGQLDLHLCFAMDCRNKSIHLTE